LQSTKTKSPTNHRDGGKRELSPLANGELQKVYWNLLLFLWLLSGVVDEDDDEDDNEDDDDDDEDDDDDDDDHCGFA